MKNRLCPSRAHCWGYKNGNCEDCAPGEALIKLHRKIERLEKKNARLEQELAAAPAIVRCKDCKHYTPCIYTEAGFHCGLHSGGGSGYEIVETAPDAFCSYGEKKEART